MLLHLFYIHNVLSVLDIYGMLLFLGVFPYFMKVWWRKLLLEPLISGNNKPLFELLSRVMWRTEKKYVLHQVYFNDFLSVISYEKALVAMLNYCVLFLFVI